MARVSIDDLAFCAEWMAAYDPAPDENGSAERRDRIVAWLRAEITRRETDAAIRCHARRLGVEPSVVRQALTRLAADT